MTQTLTTERLREIASSPSFSANPLSHEVKYMARELLANREARPVGYIAEVSGNRVGVLRGLPMPDVGSLIYIAPPAPAVPEETDLDSARMAVGFNRYIQAGYVDGWNACRAAMLAQPVSSGYKLVPAEATEDMIAAAMNCDDVEFNSDETFCVNFDNIYRAMLAAVPEGGNEK